MPSLVECDAQLRRSVGCDAIAPVGVGGNVDLHEHIDALVIAREGAGVGARGVAIERKDTRVRLIGQRHSGGIADVRRPGGDCAVARPAGER